jgi:hypothetical protein
MWPIARISSQPWQIPITTVSEAVLLLIDSRVFRMSLHRKRPFLSFYAIASEILKIYV